MDLGKGVTLFARADNLFDGRYEDPTGFQRLASAFLPGIRVIFDAKPFPTSANKPNGKFLQRRPPNDYSQQFDEVSVQRGQPSDFSSFVWLVIPSARRHRRKFGHLLHDAVCRSRSRLSRHGSAWVALRAMIAIWLPTSSLVLSFFISLGRRTRVLWGLVIGGAALLSTVVAGRASNMRPHCRLSARLGLALLLAFGGYEAAFSWPRCFRRRGDVFAAIIAQSVSLILSGSWALVALNELLSVLCKTWLGRCRELAKAYDSK